MKYKVGDKVRVRKDLNKHDKYYMDSKKDYNDATQEMINLAGEIVEIKTVDSQYTVKGSRWRWTDEMFEPVNTKKIVITSDGVETLARLYEGNKVIKTATAKCAPDDTFVFEEGARIALHRILGDYAETKAEKPTIAEGLKKCAEGVRKLADALKAQPKSDEKWRVVDRPVKVGDYIRLVKKDFSFDEVGDILKVDKVTIAGSAEVYGRNHKRPTGNDNEDWIYFREEFEVVEPVEPEQQTGHILEKIEEPEYYNGKVVCVSNENEPFCTVGGFTVGKVYTITDGIITNDTGWTNKIAGPMKTLEEVCACLGNKFIPFVE